MYRTKEEKKFAEIYNQQVKNTDMNKLDIDTTKKYQQQINLNKAYQEVIKNSQEYNNTYHKDTK